MVKIKKTYTPNPENHAIYVKEYAKFKKLFSSLSELFDMDAQG